MRTSVKRLSALSVFALLAPMVFAQPRFPGNSDPGGQEADACQTSGGGTRIKANCELETTAVRTEQQFNLPPRMRPLLSAQCEVIATTEYFQRQATARVESTLQIADCTAASGTLTFALRVRNENGDVESLEFSEPWQRTDDRSVEFTADYPIGEDASLVSVRVRNLRCSCADTPSAEADQGRLRPRSPGPAPTPATEP